MDGPEASTETLDQALIDKMNQMMEEKILSNARLSLILDSLGRKGVRRQRKEKRQEEEKVKRRAGGRMSIETGISYVQSEQVWGKWKVQEKDLPVTGEANDEQVFLSPNYNFRRYYLRGESMFSMAKKFPGHNWGRNGMNKKESMPACYLISLENPLANLPLAQELERQPKECSRLDLNLTVELLITLEKLGQSSPPLFYRTSEINGHSGEVCVGLVDGKISFLSEHKARAQKKMAICLAKDEPWM